jgi:GT2 family glycosyltransferase
MNVSPTLSIIIVNWNVCTFVLKSLESIFSSWEDAPSLEVIVVDNASTDDSVSKIKQSYPRVTIIVNSKNLGFPAGCNQGLSIASGKYILLLNPDTEIVQDALSILIQFMETHPEVGLCGPLLTYPDGTHQSSRRRFPTLSVLFLESTWLEKYAPRRILRHYYQQDIADTITQQVDWVTGSAMMIRHEVWKQVGGLDEGFFMYSEELDWCRRIKASGWHIMYVPQAKVIHHEGKSSEQVIAERHIYFQTSKIRYCRLYHSSFTAFVLHHWLRLQYICQILLESAKWLFGSKRIIRSQRIEAYIKVLESRFS